MTAPSGERAACWGVSAHLSITPRIYVACLAAYNAGHLHGRYIEASTDIEEMEEEIQAVLASSPMAFDQVYPTREDVKRHPHGGNAAAVARLRARRASERGEQTHTTEEWRFDDVEGLPGIDQYSSLTEVAEVMELIEEHGDIAVALLEELGDRERVAELLEGPYDTAESLEDWAWDRFRQEMEDTVPPPKWDTPQERAQRERVIDRIMDHFDAARYLRDHDCSGGHSVMVGRTYYIFDR